MTSERETALKVWLNRAFYADKKLRALDMLTAQCAQRAQGLNGIQHSDKGRSDTTQNSAENALLKLAEMEETAAREREKLVNITAEVWQAIRLLGDMELEAVLMHRYIFFHTTEQTAEIMHYAPRTVRAKQKQAVEKLCRLMPCFAAPDMLK